jgi:hypothetical protein
MQPASQRLAWIDQVRFAHQRQKGGLKRIFAVGLAVQHPPAHAPDQSNVSLQQLLEGGGIALLRETPQQLGIVFLQARPAQGTTASNQYG